MIRPVASFAALLGSRLAVLLGVLLVIEPVSAGAAGWVTGPPVSPAGRVARTPMIAVTPAGERIVAWEQLQTGTSESEGLAVRVAPPGGDFGPTQLIPSADEFEPSLTVGADGTAALVWFTNNSVHVARRAPGQATFGEVTPLSFGGGAIRGAVDVVLDGGDVYAAFAVELDEGPTHPAVTTSIDAVRVAAGASAVAALPGTGTAGAVDSDFYLGAQTPTRVADPSIAVVAGTVHVAWDRLDDAPSAQDPSSTTVRRATRPAAGGSFTAPIPVDTFTSQSFSPAAAFPQLTAAAGRIDLAWARGPQEQLGYQELSSGGTTQTIAVNGFASRMHAAIDATGSLLLAWEQRTLGDNATALFAVAVPPGGTAGGGGGTAGPISRLTGLNANRTLDDFVVGPDGSTLALSNRRNDLVFGQSDEQVQAAFRPSGGAFGDVEDVSGAQDRTGDGAFDRAAGALATGGSAVAAWSADDGSGVVNERIFVSERDAGAPAIGSVNVPPTAAVGVPVAMSAGATDALSPPVTIGWEFGDGAGDSARGGSATHVFVAPGTYTVTVTARDDVGNVATERRSIAIRAGADRILPVISGLASRNARFTAGRGTTAVIAVKRRPTPAGTVFTLRVNEQATLVFSFSGRLGGRRSGRRCAVGRTRGVRCTIAVEPGAIIRAGRGPGIVSIPFTGNVGGTRLAPGAYVVSVIAIDAAGNRSRPVAVRFTVVSSR